MIITSLDILSEEFLSGLTLDLFDAFLTTMAGSLNLFEGRLIGRSAEIKETLTRLYHSSNFLAESLFVKLNYQLTQQKQAHGCHKVKPFLLLRHWKEVNVEKLSKGIEPMTVCFL